MRYLRYLLILMGLWLVLVDHIGRGLGAPTLTPYASTIMVACVVLPILFPSEGRSSQFVIFSGAVLLLILLRAWAGYLIEPGSVRVLAMEIGMIGLTIILASVLGAYLNAIQTIFAELGMSKLQKQVDPFESGQHSLYREIRWARRYQEHLALLAISVNSKSIEYLVEHSGKRQWAHRLAKVMQTEIWRTYALNQVAKLLVDELGDKAIVTQRREHFVVTLTGVNREQSNAIMQRLRTASQAKLGIELDIGIALFPTEAVTFEALLQHAETAMSGTMPNANPSIGFRGEDPKTNPVAPIVSEIRTNGEVASPV